MMSVSSKIGEVWPFIVMVIMEGCTIALTILSKTAMSNGLSPFVFVVYTNALSTLILIPYSFFFHRERSIFFSFCVSFFIFTMAKFLFCVGYWRVEQPFFTLPLFLRIFFLGLTGVALAQNLAFLGLSYSSPIVVCAMGLMTPAISFILAIILRKTKLDWRSSSFRFKVIGTLISSMGASIEEFYKGPYVRKASSASLQLHHKQQLFVFYSTPDHWVLGGLLLAVSFLCVAVWNIIQVGTVKHYPQVMKIVSSYSVAGTIQCAIFAFIVERDLNAWKLKPNLDLLLIISTAIFGSIVRSSVQISFARMKGPFYVPLFQPFRIFWATFFGVGFFANSLHYGSVIGNVICGVGFYVVMWGQTKEDEKRKESNIEKADSSDEKVPLLQEEDSQV